MARNIYLKEWLGFTGIDQRDLAKASGISENQISNIVLGKNTRPPRSSTVKKLAKGIGLSDPRRLLAPPPIGESENMPTVMKMFIREWLLFRGTSQGELSKDTGITLSQISRILNGLSVPRASTLKLFARALKVDSVAMLFRDPFGVPKNLSPTSVARGEIHALASPTVTLAYFKQQCLDSKVGRYCFLSPADIEVITGRADGTVLNDYSKGLIRAMNPGEKYPKFDYPEVHAYLVRVGWIRMTTS